MPSTHSTPWAGKCVLLIGKDGEVDQVASSLSSAGCRVTLATFPSSPPSSTTTPTTTTTTNESQQDNIHRETFQLDSYDSLVKVFQKTRKREGNIDRIVLWVPAGISGPLVMNNKTQPPPLPTLVAWVIKLAAFEFRYDGRPYSRETGRGEVGLVVPSPVSRDTVLDPVDAASASSSLGITRSVAGQATLDGFKLWTLCPEEPKSVDDIVDVQRLVKDFHGILDRQHGRHLPSAEQNAPVYISSSDGLKLIDRPDNELNKAEAYKRLGERGAFAMALGTRIRDGIISFTLTAEKLNLAPATFAACLFGAAMLLYIYSWLKGWVGTPRVFWLALGAGLWKIGLRFVDMGPKSPLTRDGKRPTAVFLGSGGHTSEALQLLSALDMEVYTPRTYIISSGDSMSAEKAVAFEKNLGTGPAERERYRFIELPRARKVGQSYVSSVWTTVLSFRTAFRLLTIEPLREDGRESWDLLLVNGPGTCVVAAVATMLPRLLGMYSPRVVYIESWARVKSLSLSGKILQRVVDKFVVQWDEVDRSADTWNARSGETPPDGKAKKTDLGEYYGWLI